ncbi:MAG: hypothetical protein GF398_15515 [Chitinivibrionales bacterium]|nr:hypothetical protein [Chitinivibrionales bacterium]
MKITFIMLVLGMLWQISRADELFEVKKTGRRIQLDGFLLEWDSKQFRTWQGAPGIAYAAISTPEGLTGAFTFAKSISCSSWTFKVFADMRALHRSIRIKYAGDSASSPFFASSADSTAMRQGAVEWIIPWDTIRVDTTGRFQAGMFGYSACGDTISSLTISGQRPVDRGNGLSVLTPRLMIQATIIAILLVLFIILKMKTRKLTVERRQNQ